MEQSVDYRKRGTPDLPIAYYRNNERKTSSGRHPELEIVFVVKGTITMQLQTTNRSFSAGDIIIIPPYRIHRLWNKSKDSVLRWLVVDPVALTMTAEHIFQKEFVQPLREGRLELPEVVSPEHPVYEIIHQQIQRLDEARIYSENFKLLRFSATLQICTALLPYCRISQKSILDVVPANKIVKRCMSYMYENYTEKLTLNDIAANCFVQPNYLCAVFKKHTGQSVMNYLNKIRIAASEELLKDETIPIADIATRVGFATEVTFRENFRECKDVTPRDFRKKLVSK